MKREIIDPEKPIMEDMIRSELRSSPTPCSSKTPSMPNILILTLSINKIAKLVPKKSAILSIKSIYN